MKLFTTMLSLILIFAWILNVSAVDEKQEKMEKKEKKIRVQKLEKKAGLGVMVSNVEDDGKVGARVIEVFEGSEAENIGLKKEDVIVEVNGKPVKKSSDLMDIMKDANEGDEVQLTVLRDGSKKNLTAKLKPFEGTSQVFHIDDDDGDVYIDVMRTHHGDDNFTFARSFAETSKGGYLGVQVKKLSDQLKTYFEAKTGVLIEEVMKDSPAEKAGLKAGDIIIAVNDRDINDHQDLIRTINYYDPEEEVAVKYIRKGDNEKVKVKLAKKPAHTWSAKKMKGPGEMHWIGEDDDVKKLKVKKYDSMDDTKNIEVNKDFLIF